MEKKAERIGKENKNLSGDGEGEGGGESRVQNSPKAFGELIKDQIFHMPENQKYIYLYLEMLYVPIYYLCTIK